MARRQYLVCYDISDDKRLRAVAKRVKDFGDRMHYSVYLCVINESDLARITEILRDLIDPAEDSVLFVDLGDETDPGALNRVKTLGIKPKVRDSRQMIF